MSHSSDATTTHSHPLKRTGLIGLKLNVDINTVTVYLSYVLRLIWSTCYLVQRHRKLIESVCVSIHFWLTAHGIR